MESGEAWGASTRSYARGRGSGVREHHRDVGRPLVRARIALPAVLLLSLFLNLWGNHWGVPDRWHPDEIADRAVFMVLERRLDPEYPAYGALHHYVVAVGAVAPAGLYSLLFDPRPDAQAPSAAFEAWKDRQQARVYVLARSISGLMATAQVLIVYALGALLFDRFVGFWAALFLAVAPYFVVVAHFATVDTAANFWLWLSILFSALSWKRGGTRWTVLAALTAGLAIGTKLDRSVVLAPLVLAQFLRGEGFPAGKLALSALLVFVGYVAANPHLLISPFEFLDGTTRWFFLNLVRTNSTSYTRVFMDVVGGLAFPLFLAAVAGMAVALYRSIRGEERGAVAFLLASIVPYYIALSSGDSVDWYVPLLFPGFTLFAAYGFDRLRRAVPRKFGPAVVVGAVLVAAVSATKSVIFDLQFVNDSRYLTAAWIETHVPEGSSIELGPRGPLVGPETYEVVTRPLDPRFHAFFITWRENLERHELYQNIRETILDLERALGPSLGLPVREQPYQIAPDRRIQLGLVSRTDVVDVSAAEADYLVLVDYLEQERIKELEEPGSGYRRVARLQFRDPLGWNPSFNFLNPVVHIFRRGDLQGGAP